MIFSYITRIALSVIVFGIAIYQFIEGEIGNGIFLIILSLIVLVTVWFNEIILFTFLSIRKGKFDKAARRLHIIKDPTLLIKSQEAYYYFLDGLILTNQSQMGKADGMFKKALNTGLAMKHDRAMAKLNLAAIAAGRRRKREALNWLNQAKKDDDKKILSDQIKLLKQQMGRI
jgi:tetratricopeptide (TPR) repeat protein